MSFKDPIKKHEEQVLKLESFIKDSSLSQAIINVFKLKLESLKSKKPEKFCVYCKGCDFAFVAAYLPMDMDGFLKIMKNIHCPICAVDAKGLTLFKGEKND